VYRAVFYWDQRGRIPVQEFIECLPVKTRQKIAAWIALLEQEGPSLRRPYADKVRDKLYELRIRLGYDNIRILYFFFLRNKIVLVHVFRKKDWEIGGTDLEIAEGRMRDFMDRHARGKVTLADEEAI
jgi:phage-related protein